MKNSGVEWIGEIPEDWEVKPVKRYFSHVKRIVGDDVDKYERLSLTMQGVLKRSKDDAEGLQPEKFNGYQILKQNELVFKLIDLENVNTSRVGISPFNGLVSPAYIILSNNKKDNTFYYYWFLNMYYQEIFNKLGDGGVRSALNASDVLSLPMVYLNNETQQRIATYLDKKCSKIEETIQNQQQVIEKLKAYKQSLITEAVTGKVKIENGKVCGEYESYKDSGVEWIGKIPSGWISTRVGHLYKSMLGKMVCPNQLTEEHSLQKYLCAMNVHFDGVDLSEIKEMWFTPNEMNQYQVRNGDLLVVEGGAGAGGASIGYGLSENDKIFIQNSIHLVKPVKTNYLPKYLYYWIYSLVKQNYIDYTCNKATIPHFTKEKLEGMPIAISDKITQQEIIVYLDKKCTAIDTAIEQKQKLIVKLTEYKKSLIYECVTGKKGNLQ